MVDVHVDKVHTERVLSTLWSTLTQEFSASFNKNSAVAGEKFVSLASEKLELCTAGIMEKSMSLVLLCMIGAPSKRRKSN